MGFGCLRVAARLAAAAQSGPFLGVPPLSTAACGVAQGGLPLVFRFNRRCSLASSCLPHLNSAYTSRGAGGRAGASLWPSGSVRDLRSPPEAAAEPARGPRGPPAEEECLASADAYYQAAANALLEGLSEQLQEGQENSGLEDVDYRDGVLKIVCEGGVTLILNKHYVTKQIWYASPLSGAQYFEFSLGWTCARTGKDLLDALCCDLRAATGRAPPPLCWPDYSRNPRP